MCLMITDDKFIFWTQDAKAWRKLQDDKQLDIPHKLVAETLSKP